MDKLLTLEQAQDYLTIDPDDLDRCLEEQPDLFYAVADRYAVLVGERDLAKLELSEATAALSEDIRAKAIKAEVKITEGAIEARLTGIPKLQQLARAHIKLKTDAERWEAMKESFQQRSFMLRELVSRRVSELQSLGIERGGRASLGNSAKAQIEAVRRERGIPRASR